MSRTITRFYDRFVDAQHVVVELERIGVPHGDISLISNRSDAALDDIYVRGPQDKTAGEAAAADAGKGAAVGGVLGAAGGVLAGLGLLAIPGLGPVVAAGWLASAAVGAVVGGAAVGAAGSVVGAMTNAGVSEAEAHVYAEGVRRGGTLVSAKVADDRAALVEAALSKVPAVDVAARGDAYRASGWTRFEERAAPYTPEQIAVERSRYIGP